MRETDLVAGSPLGVGCVVEPRWPLLEKGTDTFWKVRGVTPQSLLNPGFRLELPADIGRIGLVQKLLELRGRARGFLG